MIAAKRWQELEQRQEAKAEAVRKRRRLMEKERKRREKLAKDEAAAVSIGLLCILLLATDYCSSRC